MNFDDDVIDDAGGVVAIIADSRPREPLFPKMLRVTRLEYILRSVTSISDMVRSGSRSASYFTRS